MKNLTFLGLILIAFSCKPLSDFPVSIEGELKKWHKITLVLKGPDTSEMSEVNPFLDYRIEVTFNYEGKSYTVPGYFAADGNSGQTSAKEGNIWKVHFRPDAIGIWNYHVLFRKGENLAVLDERSEGEGVGPDGTMGHSILRSLKKMVLISVRKDA